MGVIFVVLPAIWTFFYNSRHVKLTCEWRDPSPSWTDRCPLPVLALVLWMAFSAPMMLVMPLTGMGVAPFFGMFISGLAGGLYYIAMGAILAGTAWLLYRLDRRGWWLLLIGVCVCSISGMITYSQHNMLEMYQLMGYPQAQIDQIKKTGLLEGNQMAWMGVFFMLPLLGYLWFIKRYFR